jgi:hypothetical protein
MVRSEEDIRINIVVIVLAFLCGNFASAKEVRVSFKISYLLTLWRKHHR